MVGRISAQIALLAFTIAILAGLSAGNSPAMVLKRALIAMFVGLLVGKLAGWAGRLVLRDHFQRKKLAIDEAHAASTASSEPEDIGDPPDAVEAG